METNSSRNVWIDYLRSALTVLVVAHHASLAYTTFAYFDKKVYINSTAPVVDAMRWVGMDIFENFNDIFFMSLMFLISGLFVFKSLEKKGTKIYLFDRLKRLGLPFIVVEIFIIPIAYIPSFYLSDHAFNFQRFIIDYIFIQQWPVGPPWFIWILLFFNIVAAFIPSGFYKRISIAVARLAQRPFLFLISSFTILTIAYTPLSLLVGQYTWTGLGPFDFQLNRIFLYFAFFLFGVCIGSGEWQNYLFPNQKLLNKTWHFWGIISLSSYLAVTLLSYFSAFIIKTARLNSVSAYFIFDLFFVTSCLFSSLFFLAVFKQKVNNPCKLWTNLSVNAFGIYLIHYVFVTWLQFGLLNVSWPVIIKFLLVFLGSFLFSWIIIDWIRKFKPINQII